jgi:transcriptional regulator with XRE-family HTH domain
MQKKKLFDKRNERGFTQEHIADLLGMDQPQYSRRENGETKLKINEWEKIAQILAVPISEIFESDDSNIYINNENNSGDNSGYNNTKIIGTNEIVIENLNSYINLLKEEIKKVKDENQELKEKLKII